MRKIILILILSMLVFGCKKNKCISINDKCSIEYTINSETNCIQAIKIKNGKDTVLLGWDETGTRFQMENNENLACNINQSIDGDLLAYQILDNKNQFRASLNLYDNNSTSFQIQTPIFSETTNALIGFPKNISVQNNIQFLSNRYYEDLGPKGNYKIDYKEEEETLYNQDSK